MSCINLFGHLGEPPGEVGYPPAQSTALLPTRGRAISPRVPELEDAVAISAFGASTCALREDATVLWRGEYGRRVVPGAEGARVLSGDCAVLCDDRVVCFPAGGPAAPLAALDTP